MRIPPPFSATITTKCDALSLMQGYFWGIKQIVKFGNMKTKQIIFWMILSFFTFQLKAQNSIEASLEIEKNSISGNIFSVDQSSAELRRALLGGATVQSVFPITRQRRCPVSCSFCSRLLRFSSYLFLVFGKSAKVSFFARKSAKNSQNEQQS